MPTRPLIALAAALLVGLTSLSAATATPAAGARATAPAPVVRTQVDGVASDWDAARGLVSLQMTDVSAGSRGLRRAVRRGVTVTLRLTSATRLTAVDAEGRRARLTPAELFDELDLAGDEVGVEASGRVPRNLRPVAREIVLPASRLVVYLPPMMADDPAEDPDDPAWEGDAPVADAPAADDPGDDLGEEGPEG